LATGRYFKWDNSHTQLLPFHDDFLVVLSLQHLGGGDGIGMFAIIAGLLEVRLFFFCVSIRAHTGFFHSPSSHIDGLLLCVLCAKSHGAAELMLLVQTFFVHFILVVSKSHPTLPELQTYPANGFTVHGNPYFGNLEGQSMVNLEANKAFGLF
jgi:hypothetical protein